MKLYLTFTCVFLSLASFAQPTSRNVVHTNQKSNLERYKVDYELMDYDFTQNDSTIINQLDLSITNSLRRENVDQAYRDLQNNVVIIIYSVARMKESGSTEKEIHKIQ